LRQHIDASDAQHPSFARYAIQLEKWTIADPEGESVNALPPELTGGATRAFHQISFSDTSISAGSAADLTWTMS
jgi:hypothetical protein